ncbi:aldehyde dehydrogenase family protein [Rhodococcus sp. NPDC057529]|uniref:aldehyde dehydrogenase family protein n=1 Tax=Rhodococcus sp. NPDC057529 TaxID=3346158 RepID=UPI00366CC8F6
MTTTLDAPPHGQLSATTRAWLERPLRSVLIGGEHRAGASDEVVPVIDPGTGSTFTSFPAASAGDVAAAVAAARVAFDDGRWSEVDAERREELVHRLADLLRRDFETVAELESLDTGKPLADARIDVDEAIAVLRYYAGWATKVEGSVIPAPRQLFAVGTREAVGVCAAITPWNYPLPILMYKLAPAVALGNTFVAKPSELASLSTLYFAELCTEAGLPDGVVNVVAGGRATGAELSASPDLDKLAFTGSTRTGQAVMVAAAQGLTKVSLELGGKSPHVVFADADLDAAVDAVMAGIWTNAGQVCIAGSRLIIERSVHDSFLDELHKRTAQLTLGHGLAVGTDVGPLISRTQQHRVRQMIAQAESEGAEVRTSGTVPADGFFVAPTVVTGVNPGQGIERDEVFGPVLTVLPFDDEDDAVRLANDTEYGLASGVWSSNVGTIHRVARRLRAGTVWANTYGIFHPTLPFGGVKNSGFGRELGAEAVHHYTELKTTVIDLHPGTGH